MEEVRIRNKKGRLRLKTKIMLAGFVLAVIVALGTVIQAASDNTDNEDKPLFGPMSYFDPFALRTITLPAEGNSAARILSVGTSRPAIRTPLPQPTNFSWVPIVWVPIRPPLRTPLRPR